MNIIKGIPVEAKEGQLVAIDSEFFNQEEKRLHRPHGDFADITVRLEGSDDVYLMTDQHDIKKAFKAVDKGTWVMSNAVYDITQLRRFADIKPRYIWDTELVERAAYGGLYDTFSLKDQARRWLDLYMEKETREEFYVANVLTPEMERYAAVDAYNTLEIALLQRERLAGTQALEAYNRIDEPAIWPTLDLQPIKVDPVQWEKNVRGYEKIAREIEDEIEVNVFSSQQVQKALAKAGIHVQNAQRATLEEYAGHPLVDKILEAKTYRKAVSTYGLRWLERYVEEGNLVYASYRVIGAETSRRSSQNPNMQQIPARKLPEYRDLFVTKHYRMLVGDASMQELCTLAQNSHDEVLIEAIKSGEDVHQTTADAINRSRDDGKALNYAIPYGTSAQGIAKKFGIPEGEASGMLATYFMKFRGVFAYINSQHNMARKLGYVTTVAGHPVYVNPHDSQWERNAINSPIQGSAADFSKRWERLLWEGCQAEGIPYSVCGLVHDEIVTDPPKEIYKVTREIKQDAFYQAAKELFPDVPFHIDLHSGKRWSCKKLDEDDNDEEDE